MSEQLTEEQHKNNVEVYQALRKLKIKLKGKSKNEVIRLYLALTVEYAQLQQVAQMLDAQVKELTSEEESTEEVVSE